MNRVATLGRLARLGVAQDSVATGVIVAQDLEEEGFHVDQGCVDAISRFAYLLKHDLSDDFGREDLSVKERWVNDQGTKQCPELSDRLRGCMLET